ETDNWMRLTLTVAIASYLETDFAQVIERSIRSRPGVLIGAPKSVEGVRLLKDQVKLDTEDDVRRCVEGPWSARVAATERLLGAHWVGEFETLLFFHQKVKPHVHDAAANALKKKLGQLGRPPVNKEFAREAVDFYDGA